MLCTIKSPIKSKPERMKDPKLLQKLQHSDFGNQKTEYSNTDLLNHGYLINGIDILILSSLISNFDSYIRLWNIEMFLY